MLRRTSLGLSAWLLDRSSSSVVIEVSHPGLSTWLRRFTRSAFGMTCGLPPAGTTMGVGDEVAIEIETEFTRPSAA